MAHTAGRIQALRRNGCADDIQSIKRRLRNDGVLLTSKGDAMTAQSPCQGTTFSLFESGFSGRAGSLWVSKVPAANIIGRIPYRFAPLYHNGLCI
jgi:hypothetical protein